MTHCDPQLAVTSFYKGRELPIGLDPVAVAVRSTISAAVISATAKVRWPLTALSM